MIPSKSFLKNRVLKPMYGAGKLRKEFAEDLGVPKATKNGWNLRYYKAFNDIHPDLRGTHFSEPVAEVVEPIDMIEEGNTKT